MVIRSTHPLNCFCGRTFTSPLDLEEHRRARGHFPSHVCGNACSHPPVPRFEFQVRKCGQCGKICEHSGILEDHRIATGHCFFAECNLPLEIQNAQETQWETKPHASEFRCCECDSSFLDLHALNAHMKACLRLKLFREKLRKSKKAAATSSAKNTCDECHRTFSSPEGLQQHCNSIKHKPLSALACPMGKGCTGKFAAPSALLHHLESGKCRSGIDRDDIYHLIQLHDKDRKIHSLPTLTPSSSSPGSLYSRTPPFEASPDIPDELSMAIAMLPQNIFADSFANNIPLQNSFLSLQGTNSNDLALRSTLQCPLCPNTRRKFATKQALQQHMDSPIHSEKFYHCPTDIGTASHGKAGTQRKDPRHFTTLSGLAQHLESGACFGGKKTFLYYVDMIQRQITRWGYGEMRLLLPGSAA